MAALLELARRWAAGSIPDVRLSDHSPFWDAGTNALMVTDTSFMRNPHYHQMSDTVEALDLPFLRRWWRGRRMDQPSRSGPFIEAGRR